MWLPGGRSYAAIGTAALDIIFFFLAFSRLMRAIYGLAPVAAPRLHSRSLDHHVWCILAHLAGFNGQY